MSVPRLRCDVAVLGGGIAGLLAARRLAASADVLRVAPAPDCGSPRPASETSLGLVACGGHDSPVRLAHAVGAARAEALWRWSRRACDGLLELAEALGTPARRDGVWRVSLSDREAEEWRDSARLAELWDGVGAVETVEGEGLPARAGVAGAAFGARIARDGTIDLPALLGALRDSTERVPLHRGSARIAADSSDGVLLRTDAAEIRAELVVVATGIGAERVSPFFADKLYPVALQALRVPLPAGPPPAPAFARHRYELWAPASDGGLDFAGCRWADPPEMGAGVRSEAPSDRVLAKQRAFLETHLGVPRGAEARSVRVGVQTYSCDGLPLLGPLPGEPRVLSLVGWNGWGLSAVHAAVEEVCGLALGEAGAAAGPELLQARRMT